VNTNCENCKRLEKRLAELEQSYIALEQRNQELELQVRELLARLNSNSSNSHKPPSSEPPKFEPSDTRFSEGSRSRSWSQKTWGMGRQRVEKGDEALESLPHWTNFAKTTESGYEANAQQIQDSGEMRASIRRQVYSCSLRKHVIWRKISQGSKSLNGLTFAQRLMTINRYTTDLGRMTFSEL
jgi:hypothetical protein